MRHKILHLKELYPFLKKNEYGSTVECLLPFNDLVEMQVDKRPCVIICPGGGYATRAQREAEPIGVHFLSMGFNVFVLQYSSAPDRFPTQMLEVAAVMDIIYRNAEAWNCDTEKICILGSSAGGHLAAHYSTMFDCKEVRKFFPDSHAVNATVLCYPVITADPIYAHLLSFENLVGKKILSAEEINYFSCERNVKPTTPPAFIWHTVVDDCVPVMNSVLYAEALSKQHVPFELHIYPYGPHGMSTCDGITYDTVDEIMAHNRAWLDNLKGWFKIIGFTK